MRLGKSIPTFYNYKEDADKNEATFGKTPSFKFADDKINECLRGGLAKPNATNIILVYGATGIGKSLISLNICASAIREKKKFALILLEDDASEALIRLRKFVPEQEIYKSPHVILGEKDIKVKFTRREALELFEDLIVNQSVDIIILDHIQFMFEATAESSENEWIRQRNFVQEINNLFKRYKKALVLVSHIKKGEDFNLNSTTGSNALPQVATKALGIYRDKKGEMFLQMSKSRYTQPYFNDIPIKFVNFELRYNDHLTDKKKEANE